MLVAQHELALGHTVTVGIAQQHQPVGRAATGTSFAHQHAGNPAGETAHIAFGCAGFGNDHIAIGQRQHRAWMIEPGRKPRDGQALGRSWCLVRRPADRLGDRDTGQCFGIGFDQHRIFARQLVGGVQRVRRTGHHVKRDGKDEDHDCNGDQNFAEFAHGATNRPSRTRRQLPAGVRTRNVRIRS